MGVKKIIGKIRKYWVFLLVFVPYVLFGLGIPEMIGRGIGCFLIGFCMPVGVTIWYVTHLAQEIKTNAKTSVLDDKRKRHHPISNDRRKVNLVFCLILFGLIGYGFEIPLLKDFTGLVFFEGSTVIKNKGTVSDSHGHCFRLISFIRV